MNDSDTDFLRQALLAIALRPDVPSWLPDYVKAILVLEQEMYGKPPTKPAGAPK